VTPVTLHEARSRLGFRRTVAVVQSFAVRRRGLLELRQPKFQGPDGRVLEFSLFINLAALAIVAASGVDAGGVVAAFLQKAR